MSCRRVAETSGERQENGEWIEQESMVYCSSEIKCGLEEYSEENKYSCLGKEHRSSDIFILCLINLMSDLGC